MASASASAAVKRHRVFGIDPGSVNMGLCERDLSRNCVTSLERVQFRAPGTGSNDLGSARLIGQVTAWIRANAARFSDSVIFIENQPPDAHGREGQAVQHTFQAFFGDQCVPVNAGAAKARYGEHFPRHPRYEEFPANRRAENQKAFDRKNAIIFGRKYVPEAVKDEYERKNPKKKDDAYEAALYALYGADCMIDADGTLRDAPTPIPRRKRGDVHPRGRPAAKSASKPKAKAKAAPKPKAKRAASKKRAAPSKDVVSSDDDDDDVIDLTARAIKRRRT